MSTCHSPPTPTPTTTYYMLGFASLKGQLARIVNCQKFTQLPRPPTKELTTPTTRVPLAHTKWSLVVNTKWEKTMATHPIPS